MSRILFDSSQFEQLLIQFKNIDRALEQAQKKLAVQERVSRHNCSLAWHESIAAIRRSLDQTREQISRQIAATEKLLQLYQQTEDENQRLLVNGIECEVVFAPVVISPPPQVISWTVRRQVRTSRIISNISVGHESWLIRLVMQAGPSYGL